MAKRSGLKIALIVIGICAGLGILTVLVCAGSGYYWFKSNVPEMRETGRRAYEEGVAFAATHTQSECLDEGFRRHDGCGQGMEIMCRAEARMFLERCLADASETPGICDGVPAPTEIMAGATWAARFCAEHGRGNDQQCGNFVRAVVEHCGRVARQSASPLGGAQDPGTAESPAAAGAQGGTEPAE